MRRQGKKMAKVLIIYHSQSGNTEVMAKAVSEAAAAAGGTVVLKKAADARADDILSCDVVAIGSPNYFGYMAGMVKDYFDRVWATIREKMAGKPYVTFGSKGGGGAKGIESVDSICDGLKMTKAFESVLATRQPTPEVLAQCRDLGRKLARMEKTTPPAGIQEPRL
jgi:flavorubredoxin